MGVNQKVANKKCIHNEKKKRQINASKPVKGALNRKRGKREIGSGEIWQWALKQECVKQGLNVAAILLYYNKEP